MVEAMSARSTDTPSIMMSVSRPAVVRAAEVFGSAATAELCERQLTEHFLRTMAILSRLLFTAWDEKISQPQPLSLSTHTPCKKINRSTGGTAGAR